MKSIIKINLSAGALIVFTLFLNIEIAAQNKADSLQVGIQPDGSILGPTNQLLRPAGYVTVSRLQILKPNQRFGGVTTKYRA